MQEWRGKFRYGNEIAYTHGYNVFLDPVTHKNSVGLKFNTNLMERVIPRKYATPRGFALNEPMQLYNSIVGFWIDSDRFEVYTDTLARTEGVVYLKYEAIEALVVVSVPHRMIGCRISSHANVPFTAKQIVNDTIQPPGFFPRVPHEVYMRYYQLALDRLNTWTMLAARLGIHKDMRRMIAEFIWDDGLITAARGGSEDD